MSELPETPQRSVRFPWDTLPESEWDRRLEGLRGLGFHALRLDLAWISESEESLSRRLGLLVRLLDRARAAGLAARIQPGPWLPEAAADGGIPEDLLSLESVRARPGIPCTASLRLGLEAEQWLGRIGEHLAPHLHPSGPIVEWCAATPLAQRSHSPDARRFVARYRLLSRRPGARPEATDGREEVEAAEAIARTWIARALRVRPRRADGRSAPLRALVRDWPPASGADPRLAAEDAGSVSVWLAGRAACDLEELRRFGLRTADLPGRDARPGVAGLPAGRNPLAPARALPASLIAGVLAMCGVASLDFEELPRGDDADALADLFQRLDAIDHARLERESDLLWIENRDLQRPLPGRDGALASDLGDPATLDALRACPGSTAGDAAPLDPAEIDALPTARALFSGLRRAGVALAVADSSLDAARLERAAAALLVGFERIDPALLERLVAWAERGGQLILGPRIPSLDLQGSPLEVALPLTGGGRLERVSLGKLQLSAVERIVGGTPVIETSAGILAAQAPLGRGRLTAFGFPLPFASEREDPRTLCELALHLASAAEIAPREWLSDPAIEVELFRGPERRFLLMANPTPETREVELRLPAGEALREVRGRGQHARRGARLRIPGSSVWIRELVAL
ncbi:MAG: hypothetical protein ACE5IL_15300 [Myxococcota bacterium]